jgi:hypothetical protein
MFSSVEVAKLPDDAMLGRYGGDDGSYTDCYSAEVSGSVELSDYIRVFYTSPVFKLERLILSVLVSKPSTDTQVNELAAGERNSFAAWNVEDRDSKQILLSDFRGRTCSWLMVVPLPGIHSTRLYFGSAVVFGMNASGEPAKPTLAFRLLSGFHRLYSRILLGLACRALMAENMRLE